MCSALLLTFASAGGGAATSGPSPLDTALLGSVVQGMTTDLSSVTLGDPPSDFASAVGSKWLDATHKSGNTPAQNAEDAWYTYLIAGAYGAQCGAAGADCLSGYTFVGSNGPQEDDGSGRLVIQSVPLTSASPQDLSTTIRNRLAAEGISATSISFEQPYGLAAVVEIQSNNRQSTVDTLHAAEVFAGLGLDGYLVRVVDSTGNVVYLEDTAYRAQAGQGWAAPGLAVPNLP